MSNGNSKPIRSPSYPSLPLRDAMEAVRKIEAKYRSAPVPREEAAKIMGYSSLSGPANKALAALASYGLLERAGKGEARVTERARAILHFDSKQEKKDGLIAAALEPQLFREIRERYQGLVVPPEEGVVNYLNRQGFNPNAVRPAARAFLQTMSYLEELGATESYGSEVDGAGESHLSGDGQPSPTYAGARVGDTIQWESQGALQLPRPLRVRAISEDGDWVFVEGSETGIPMDEVIVEEQGGAQGTRTPPKLPLDQSADATPPGETEWMRNALGGDTRIRLMVKGEMGPKEIKKLIRLLEAQQSILSDEDE